MAIRADEIALRRKLRRGRSTSPKPARSFRWATASPLAFGRRKRRRGELISYRRRTPESPNLEEDQVGAVLLGEYSNIQGRRRSAHTGYIYVGSVETWWAAWSTPWASRSTARDDRGPRVQRDRAPGARRGRSGNPSSSPYKPASKAIGDDPHRRGQRELIIGDRRASGKTTVALDAYPDQKGSDVICSSPSGAPPSRRW